MSTGTPVMITKTEGFWDPNLFIDSKNIFFVYENTLEAWQKKFMNSMKIQSLFMK